MFENVILCTRTFVVVVVKCTLVSVPSIVFVKYYCFMLKCRFCPPVHFQQKMTNQIQENRFKYEFEPQKMHFNVRNQPRNVVLCSKLTRNKNSKLILNPKMLFWVNFDSKTTFMSSKLGSFQK